MMRSCRHDSAIAAMAMRGAFAYDGKLRFIAPWPERRPKQTLRIHYNVITVEP